MNAGAAPRAVLLSPAHLRAIEAAAERAYPEECCGLLAGRADGRGGRVVVTRVVESANFAADRRRRFEVDPGLFIALERSPPGAPDRLIGLYHSHPDGPAAPSAADVASAWRAGLAWLVTAVDGGRAGATTAHLLVEEGGPFRAMALEVAV